MFPNPKISFFFLDWEVMEQVCIAAFDTSNKSTYDVWENHLNTHTNGTFQKHPKINSKKKKEILPKIKTKFGETERVKKLIAMKHEAEGNFYEADKIYQRILETDGANIVQKTSSIHLRSLQANWITKKKKTKCPVLHETPNRNPQIPWWHNNSNQTT